MMALVISSRALGKAKFSIPTGRVMKSSRSPLWFSLTILPDPFHELRLRVKVEGGFN